MIGYTLLGLALLVGTVTSFPRQGSEVPQENGNDLRAPTKYNNEGARNKVEFYLYTQKTLNNPVKTRVNDWKLFGGNIDLRKPVKLTIHGYMSHKDRGFSKNIREGFLKNADVNVVTVDWSKDASSLMYNRARNAVPEVGKVVAEFIDRMVRELGMNPANLHVLGHSLGAHIAGVAGLNVKSGLLNRITGLDPAGPLFSYNDKERLMPSCAAFVDVIHTAGATLGFLGNLGHVDFYPNNGTPSQPGCGTSFGKCSHDRAIFYYIESISNPRGFLGRQCDSWDNYTKGKCDNNPSSFMGENVPRNARGKFWLKTGTASPFGLGPNARSH